MLTDENLEVLLRTTFAAESASLTSPPGLSANIRRRHAIARRRIAFTATAPVVVAAVAAAVTIAAADPSAETESAAHPSPGTESEVTSDPSRVQLAGYTFILPERYGARDGSCELELPDRTARTGIPGSDGACAVLLETSFTPSWFSANWPAGVWIVGVNEENPEFVTVTITGRDPATERCLVLAMKLPRDAEIDLSIEDLEKIMDDGLAAAQSAPN